MMNTLLLIPEYQAQVILAILGYRKLVGILANNPYSFTYQKAAEMGKMYDHINEHVPFQRGLYK